MANGELIDIIPAHNTLGESVIWDVRTHCLWWLDIEKRQLLKLDHEPRNLETFTTPERLCSFGFTTVENQLIAAFESGFAWYQPYKDKIQWIARPSELAEGNGLRLNDGRVDRQGRFWCGSMVEDTGKSSPFEAQLYSLHRDSTLLVHESRIGISNGICWSPDNRYFYFADSRNNAIYRYEFDDANGRISNRIVFAETPDNAHPDGAVVDAEGFLWSAHWGAGRVVRYSPEGAIDRLLEVPTSQPTCIAFGGPDLNRLFVTSARQGLHDDDLNRNPQAGDVFVYQLDVRGIPEPLCNAPS